MANNRIFYACQAVGVKAPFVDDNNIPTGRNLGNFSDIIHGVQSVGVTTNFNLEQVFELGQIQIYENAENIPEIEVTLEKVLDGHSLLFTSTTAGAGSAQVPSNNSLVNRSAERCDVYLGIYDETNDVAGGGAGLQSEVRLKGLYLNSISYTIPTDGPITESITLVGNEKIWSKNSTNVLTNSGAVKNIFDNGIGNTEAIPNDNKGDDVPYNSIAANTRGGIQRRENVIMQFSAIPVSVIRAALTNHPALDSISTGLGNNVAPNESNYAHIQSITISADFGREDILELGRKTPYYRAATFPIEVTCDIEVIASEGDWVNAYEKGDPTLIPTRFAGDNTREESIFIALQDGTKINLGNKNRLSSVTYGGGDASGGNATMTFSYSTFNDLSVTPPNNKAA